jgi:predicted transglutaminase-like cysteine proteinase
MGMSYNWEGDMILHNTLIEKKRYVIGTAGTPIKADIREWISFEDNIVMKEVINQLIVEKKLPGSRNPGDFDRRARSIWDFVARNISYVHDSEKQSKEDFWLFPPEIYTLKQGDCEDGSFLLATLLIASGISPFCVRIVLGEVFNTNGRSIGSHCWPVYKNETGKWCILESTLDRIPSRFPPADNLAEKKQSYRYAPYYCFNNRHLWLIFPEDDREAKMPKNLNRYLKLRRNKVNMKATRSPSD